MVGVQIGLYIRLFGRPSSDPPPPSWTSMAEQAHAAEAAGFDRVVVEDGLLYRDDERDLGVWEAVSIAAALAASTTRVGIGHAVINSPYRPPGLVAAMATTLDEIAGGRYTLGIGAGNTPDDYPRFGIDADPRYGRFAEAIQIIHGLLRGDSVTFQGTYYRVSDARIVLRGPRPAGPPIAIAGGKPKMLRLAARYADEWNWWSAEPDGPAKLALLADELERACAEVDRDPATLRRSVDIFSVMAGGEAADSPPGQLMIGGPADAIAAALLEYAGLGFEEVRVNLKVPAGMSQSAGIEWMADVVDQVHAG